MRSNSRVLLAALLVALALPLAGQQRRTYPTGTAFEESFGNVAANPDSCWSGGPASCDQLWIVTAGSGQEIVAAPSGWTGSALELPSGATALSLETFGSFPAIPANSGFTLTVQIEMSAFDSGYSNLLTLRDSSGDNEVTLGDHSTGFDEGFGNPCAASAGAVHTLTVVIAGASSAFSIDGTQCGADFSDPGYAPFELVLNGSTANNVWVRSVEITGATVTGGWPPSAFMDFAGSGGTPTVATLAAGTHCGDGTWTLGSLTGVTFSYVSGSQAFASPLSVCGANYANNSGVSLEMAVSTTAGASGADKYALASIAPSVVVGYWVQYTVSSTTASYYTDTLAVYNGSGDEVNTQIQDGTVGHLAFCLEEANGTTTANCSALTPSQSTWYWLTFGNVSGTDQALDIYSASGSLLESVACTGCTGFTLGGGQAEALSVGKTGNETNTGIMDVTYSGVTVCYMDCTFPMAPPAAPSSAPCAIGLLGVGVCRLRAPMPAARRRAA